MAGRSVTALVVGQEAWAAVGKREEETGEKEMAGETAAGEMEETPMSQWQALRTSTEKRIAG